MNNALGTLVLMRHAKSTYPPGVHDHDRPLNRRGGADARAASAWFTEHRETCLQHEPIVFVSSALRTQQTWQLVQPSLPDAEVRTSPDLYAAGERTIIDLVADSIERGRDTLVIAHNPGLERLTDLLSRKDAMPQELPAPAGFATSAIAVLRIVDSSWAGGSAKLLAFAVPRG